MKIPRYYYYRSGDKGKQLTYKEQSELLKAVYRLCDEENFSRNRARIQIYPDLIVFGSVLIITFYLDMDMMINLVRLRGIPSYDQGRGVGPRSASSATMRYPEMLELSEEDGEFVSRFILPIL